MLGRVGIKTRVVFVEIVSDAALRKAITLDGQFELIGIANHFLGAESGVDDGFFIHVALERIRSNDGPSEINGAKISTINASRGAGVPESAFKSPTFPLKGDVTSEDLILQDTRDWFAWHSGSVNVVFADGSVRALEDVNGDGYINPGFRATGLVTSASGFDSIAEAQSATVGYQDSETEVNPWELFSGTFLNDGVAGKGFE